MKPYYESDGISLYLGDCRDLVDELAPRCTVLATDPPYGVALGTGDQGRTGEKHRGVGHGLAKAGYRSFGDTKEEWIELVPPVLYRSVKLIGRGVVFAGVHVTHLPAPDTVGGIYCPASHGLNRWGFSNLQTVFFYGCSPTNRFGPRHTMLMSNETAVPNGHPCPKPIGWMNWLLDLATVEGNTVFDPFAGSGTTLVAAKAMGLRAIGIERERDYCDIAVDRLRQGVLFGKGAA